MSGQITKIEVLTERDFDRLIDEHDVEKFMCSGDKCTEPDNIVHLAFHADFDLFGELADQLIDSDYGFRLYTGSKNENQKCTLLEFYN